MSGYSRLKKTNELFLFENIILNLEAKDKWDCISQLASILAQSINLTDTSSLIDVIYTREKQMSTGLEYGIALPHAKTEIVSSIVCAIGIAPQGIEFDSLDGIPAKIIIMILSPKEYLTEHMQLMAGLTRILSVENNRRQILNTKNKAEIHKILSVKSV